MATTNITGEQFTATIEGNDIVLVDFWAAWCGPCRQFGPIFEKVSEKHDDVAFVKVDTETERELSAALKISSIPTVMGFRENVLVFSHSGVLSEPQLGNIVEAITALDMTEVHAKLAASPTQH
ncbi:thioredoxin [Arthrobacter sp. OAP107]|uniref:thioredoxin n=1 Tax=Arthrobacter sp. OAP107 TaxID=3156445 RepID=UPI003396F9D8